LKKKIEKRINNIKIKEKENYSDYEEEDHEIIKELNEDSDEEFE
jgi:hypothetical protein